MTSKQSSPVTFDKNDVEIIARESLYRGFFSLNSYRFRHRLFNGEMSGEVKREILSVVMPQYYCLMIHSAMKWYWLNNYALRPLIARFLLGY